MPTLILMVPLLALLRRWPDLPAGAATLLVGGTMAALTFLHDGQILIGAPILGGVLIDLVLLAIAPARFGRWPIAALAPTVLWIAYFVVVARTGPVAWTAPHRRNRRGRVADGSRARDAGASDGPRPGPLID